MTKRIPDSVYRLVVAEVKDYERKKRLLESGSLTSGQMMDFTRKVSAIDNALTVVCMGECQEAREALISDIANGKGFKNGAAKSIYSSIATYKRRKMEAIALIAGMLGLV